jgi:hypothetical protein
MICSVNGIGIVGAGFAFDPFGAIEPFVKAALVTVVADARAEGFNFDEERVVVAIGGDFLDDQAVAGAFAFHPQLVSGAAVESDEAGGAGFFEGFGVHEADHEDAVRGRVLNDGREEAVEFGVIESHFVCCFICLHEGPEAIKKPAGTAAGVLSFDL